MNEYTLVRFEQYLETMSVVRSNDPDLVVGDFRQGEVRRAQVEKFVKWILPAFSMSSLGLFLKLALDGKGGEFRAMACIVAAVALALPSGYMICRDDRKYLVD